MHIVDNRGLGEDDETTSNTNTLDGRAYFTTRSRRWRGAAFTGMGEVTPGSPATQSSNGFLDMITKTIGTIAQGAVQYKLNAQAIKAGQGSMVYGGAPAPQIKTGVSDPGTRNMLIAGAVALGGLFLLMRKR